MAVDISHLQGLNPNVPTAEWDTYDVGGDSKPLPPEGTYLMRSKTPLDPKEDLSVGKDGQLIIRNDPTIIAGPAAGYVCKYNRVSTKRYANRNASPAGDYLKAIGYRGQPTTPNEYADAAAAVAGQTFEAETQWRARDKDTGFEVKGMENFPTKPDGTRQSWVAAPGTGPGQPLPLKRVWANLEIKNYRAKK